MILIVLIILAVWQLKQQTEDNYVKSTEENNTQAMTKEAEINTNFETIVQPESEYATEEIVFGTEEHTNTKEITANREKDLASMAIDVIEQRYPYSQGMLLDIDFDGNAELMIFENENGITYCDIFKLDSENATYFGCIATGDIFHQDKKEMFSLYFDEKSNKYVYYAETLSFLKNASESQLYGFYACSLDCYTIDEKLQSETVLNYMIEIRDSKDSKPIEEIDTYYSNRNEYLKDKKKVMDILLEPMWTWEDIENETYKDIIREYFQ